MYHVLSCKKYARKTLRVVQIDCDLDAVMNGAMGECVLCGPCSHVELGSRSAYWDHHYSCDSEDEATAAAWQLTEDHPGQFSTSDLPPCPEIV